MRATTPDQPDQLSLFSFMPTCVPQGNGSVLVWPGKPVSKLTLIEAAKVLRTSYATARRLYFAGLISGERTSPHGIRIYADSLQQHMQRAQDVDLWETEAMAAYKKALN